MLPYWMTNQFAVLHLITDLMKSEPAAASVHETDDLSVLFLGVHPHPGQWVECLQTLHGVQGAAQPPENPVSTCRHLQLPTQESNRKQGELTVTLALQRVIHLGNMEIQKQHFI